MGRKLKTPGTPPETTSRTNKIDCRERAGERWLAVGRIPADGRMRAPERDKETLKNNVTFFFFERQDRLAHYKVPVTESLCWLDYYRYGYKNNIATDPIGPRWIVEQKLVYGGVSGGRSRSVWNPRVYIESSVRMEKAKQRKTPRPNQQLQLQPTLQDQGWLALHRSP